MSQETIKTGDRVMLKSGPGPAMVVEHVKEASRGRVALCTWANKPIAGSDSWEIHSRDIHVDAIAQVV